MTSQQTQQQQCTNNSTYSDILPLTNNQQSNKSSEINNIKVLPGSSNLNKSHQFTQKDIRSNKLNMNSSLNIPSGTSGTNISLNEQILHQQKEHNDYFDNDVSYQEEDEIDPIFKEYTLINNTRNKAIDEIKNIIERIKNNKLKIEENKEKLIDLKEEKKKKQADIINLLSNKESIEEIYKNQIYLLINHINGSNSSNNFNDNNNTLNNDINNLINISLKNEINDNSAINLNSMHNITILDNEILNTDEDNFKITINEIKGSDPKKYVEQVINMFEDIFKKRDDKINTSISSIINNSYELFMSNNSNNENDKETNNETEVNNFFGKMSLFISNHSFGKYSEAKINLFLRYLLKINAIGTKLNKYIKFVNKKYKEKKKELNDMISFLEKKNINLAEKKNRLENNIKEYEERLEFFGKNDVFEIEQNYEGDELLDNYKDDEEKNSSSNLKSSNNTINQKRKRKTNKNNIIKSNNLENEGHLSHDVVIEYEDGIDQNAEINYEDDDLTDEYDYEKENEMIKQGLNPYNKDINKRKNSKKNTITNKQRYKKGNKNQIIVNDNDESDKYLNEFLQNKDFTNIKDENNISKNSNILDNNKEKNKFSKRNSKNIIRNIPKNNYNLSPSSKNRSNELGQKIIYNSNISYDKNNITDIHDNRIYSSNLYQNKINDFEDKLTPMELDHYNRVQRIMSGGPNINNIFGVNNYNPENDSNREILFSPKRNTSNGPTSSNKIDKTIRYGSRKNHNFISIINMTKNVPNKKKNGKDKAKTKEKSKKNKNIGNDGTIKVINLEENFLNEISCDGIKNESEIENKMVNESTSVLTKSNMDSNFNNNKSVNISHISKVNDHNKSNIEKDENSKIINNRNKKNNNSNNNEVQGYFLNIINSRPSNKEKNKPKFTDTYKDEDDNINTKTQNKEFNNTSHNKALRVINSREISINEIKNSKLGMITKKNIPKTMIARNGDKTKQKANNIKVNDTKEINSLNKSQSRPKPYISINTSRTVLNNKKVSNNALSGIKSANNSYVNINETSKRSFSLKESQEQENNRNFGNRTKQYNIKKINNTNTTNNITNPVSIKRGKISNIPVAKTKMTYNRSYNNTTFETKFKSASKIDNSKNRK